MQSIIEEADWTAAGGAGPGRPFSWFRRSRVAQAALLPGTGTELLVHKILFLILQTCRLRRGQMDWRFPDTPGQDTAQSSDDGFV